MSSKIQVKKKKARSRQKGTQIEDEIAEIEEIPSRRTSKKYPKKKENTENSSSEATTPNKKNKKKQNKKEKTLELIEIMDIEIPDGEFSFGKKKSSAPPPKQNKTPNKDIQNDKHKKKGKSSIKSVSKLTTKDKDKVMQILSDYKKDVYFMKLVEKELRHNFRCGRMCMCCCY